jgi:hypothetical protein
MLVDVRAYAAAPPASNWYEKQKARETGLFWRLMVQGGVWSN